MDIFEMTETERAEHAARTLAWCDEPAPEGTPSLPYVDDSAFDDSYWEDHKGHARPLYR